MFFSVKNTKTNSTENMPRTQKITIDGKNLLRSTMRDIDKTEEKYAVQTNAVNHSPCATNCGLSSEIHHFKSILKHIEHNPDTTNMQNKPTTKPIIRFK